jgi:hypothetical protein
LPGSRRTERARDTPRRPVRTPVFRPNVVGSQYLIGDQKNVEVFSPINDARDNHYYVAGSFFPLGGFTNVSGGPNRLASLSDPRTFVPGMPFAAYGGVRVKF